MEKTIVFEGHYVDCEFEGENWWNSLPYLEWVKGPIEMTDEEIYEWQERLFASDVWADLYKLSDKLGLEETA